MIGQLRGRLVSKQPPALIVDVQGVGYEVEAPMSTFYTLPPLGSELTLLTHLVVREDAHVLYGFASEAERRLFRSLLRVSGVGARMALAILSGINPTAFIECIRAGDTAALIKLPGIGRKTAERLIVEMRDRIESGRLSLPSEARPSASSPVGDSALREAFNGLTALGYKPAEVTRMMQKVETAGLSTEEIIRRVLQLVAAS